MATTYLNLATTTISSNTASVSFSSIAQTYTDLVIRYSGRATTGGTNVGTYITFNGSSSAIYCWTVFGYSGTVLVGTQASGSTRLNASTSVNGSLALANVFSTNELYIPNYTANNHKPMLLTTVTENNATTGWGNFYAGLWKSTSAISSITLTPESDSWVSGSTFYLYGVKNS